jgi:hypothetical protein
MPDVALGALLALAEDGGRRRRGRGPARAGGEPGLDLSGVAAEVVPILVQQVMGRDGPRLGEVLWSGMGSGGFQAYACFLRRAVTSAVLCGVQARLKESIRGAALEAVAAVSGRVEQAPSLAAMVAALRKVREPCDGPGGRRRALRRRHSDAWERAHALLRCRPGSFVCGE